MKLSGAFKHTLVLMSAFILGVSAFNLNRRWHQALSISPVATNRQDDLHKVYQASLDSYDDVLRNDVRGRLLCMGPDESWANRLVVEENNLFCIAPDGERHPQLIYHHNFVTGLDMIEATHSNWAAQNVEFLTQISTPASARRYVKSHLP
jgi:hypothetical protein